ncbi:hypothetical protein Anapl_17163 [Anas platyrhynchos]|uniref:Uncharacterized protein n=1 Tax=Anas platyrhynchos TaxID=8839 RepID=R0KKA2_ANAPL|nr:hypothetical protein Anapl_17163 [Anas platyrhynchos]
MGSLLGLPTAAVLLVLQLLWAGSCPEQQVLRVLQVLGSRS